jgi:lipoyl(octanoyl) transferase
VPCGISDKAVTSMQKELGRETDLAEVAAKVKNHLVGLFEMQLIEEKITH